MYSNRMRGDRKKKEEREKEKRADENETIEVSKISDGRNYKPKRIPQQMWRECIKKVWEVVPLLALSALAKCALSVSYIKRR